MLGPEAHIILACEKHKNENDCQINLRWEKGHQDKEKKYKDISEAAQLNVGLDHLAENTQIHHSIMPVTPYPRSGASLIINEKHITTNYRSCIKNAVMEQIHLEYFLERYKKHKMTAATYNSIYWRGIGRARNKIHHRQKRLPD